MPASTARQVPASPLADCVEAAAANLGISRAKTFEELAAGRLRSFKVGRRRLISKAGAGRLCRRA